MFAGVRVLLGIDQREGAEISCLCFHVCGSIYDIRAFPDSILVRLSLAFILSTGSFPLVLMVQGSLSGRSRSPLDARQALERLGIGVVFLSHHSYFVRRKLFVFIQLTFLDTGCSQVICSAGAQSYNHNGRNGLFYIKLFPLQTDGKIRCANIVLHLSLLLEAESSTVLAGVHLLCSSSPPAHVEIAGSCENTFPILELSLPFYIKGFQ